MTVIVNLLWGGRVTQVVDRQISRPGRGIEVIDRFSTKICVVLCTDALVSIAYTGIAITHRQWMDTVIADCLSHRELGTAMIQPGASALARPLHVIANELALNLNSRLNSDVRTRAEYLQVSMIGWHLGGRPRPLAWELVRDPPQANGMRYLKIRRRPIGKFMRQHPRGLWGETLGDPGATVDDSVRTLEQSQGLTHDDVERIVREAINRRATETDTVSSECLAVQLDPFDSDGQVQFTRYPSTDHQDDPVFASSWVVTPRLICSPGTQSTYGSTYSDCGRYLLGGFSDGGTNLHVRTRLPVENTHFGGPAVLAYKTQKRARTT